MKNFFKNIFKRNPNSKNINTKTKRIFAGQATTKSELLQLKYDGLRKGYNVVTENFSSSLSPYLFNVYYC